MTTTGRTGTSASTSTAAAPALDLDWEAAGRWAGRLASPGPTPSRAEMEDLVAHLHEAADRARTHALRAARLGPPVEAAGNADARPQVLVVDRAGWARGAAQSFASLTPGSGGPAAEVRSGQEARAAGIVAGVRSAPVTAQAAGVLGLVAGRVLGQFDPYSAGGGASGRLLLVAPNVLRTERALAADPADFRLWVCVHEQTHALQFAAAPWLADHLRSCVADLVEDLSRSTAGHEIATAVTRALRALRSGEDHAGDGEAGGDAESSGGADDWSVLDLVLDEQQRAKVEQVTAVMSLLEGHADVAMDAVGVRVIPSIRRLRARMDARRRTATGVDRLVRRLIGMDAKLAQYRRGAAFVRTVRRSGGRDALDAVWSGPDALPTAEEIAEPTAWVRRVHG